MMRTVRLQFALEHLPEGSLQNNEGALAPQAAQPRYLNTLGRWAAYGTDITPLLVWQDESSAHAACTAARVLRNCPGIVVSPLQNGGHRASAHTKTYSPSLAPALAAPLPAQNTAYTRKAADCIKTAVFSHAVLTLEAASGDAKSSLETLWNKHIHALFGGGSVVSASQFLTGKRACAAAEMIAKGHYSIAQEHVHREIMQAMAIASGHPWNRCSD